MAWNILKPFRVQDLYFLVLSAPKFGCSPSSFSLEVTRSAWRWVDQCTNRRGSSGIQISSIEGCGCQWTWGQRHRVVALERWMDRNGADNTIAKMAFLECSRWIKRNWTTAQVGEIVSSPLQRWDGASYDPTTCTPLNTSMLLIMYSLAIIGAARNRRLEDQCLLQ